ncbi:MAG: hypothetical protein GWP03_00955 [Proteobacteria bacterium]|nr:hypothetical protein [Pseudomonadota bacterium]
MKIVLIVITLLLPIFLGYFFKLIKLFNKEEIATLRKFVVKVTVPFIIFRNLYKADMESLSQIYPAMLSLIILSLLYMITAYFVSNFISKDHKKQNSYAFATFVGNYGYLGWGVLYYFYGNAGFTRSVFFTLLFWPVFLSTGFFLVYLKNRRHAKSNNSNFLSVMIQHATVPLLTAIIAIVMNIAHISIPNILSDFIDKFANITIPMILFTIGLNFTFRMKRTQFKIIISSSLHRLVFGFLLGVITVFLTALIFRTDKTMTKVILIESIMPTAAMAPLFEEYIDIDGELMSGIITFSTILSLITIPIWYYIIQLL